MISDEEILEMARQIGFTDEWQKVCVDWPRHLISFARLIAEKQKEADARICEEAGPNEYPLRLVSDGFAAAIRGQKP